MRSRGAERLGPHRQPRNRERQRTGDDEHRRPDAAAIGKIREPAIQRKVGERPRDDIGDQNKHRRFFVEQHDQSGNRRAGGRKSVVQ